MTRSPNSMLKKATLHPPSPVRAETRTWPELRSHLAHILNVPHGKERVLARLGLVGVTGGTPAALLDSLFEHAALLLPT
jgi:hypothetical protein